LDPHEDLQPTHTPLGVDPVEQAETLRRLRAFENEGRMARFRRNDLLAAAVLSHTVSRPDMARAIGVSVSRLNQIVAGHAQLLQHKRNLAAAERVARHLPQ
jgi:hypothetical protein